VTSSFWRELAVEDVRGGPDAVTARVTLRTEQAPEDGPDGQDCSWRSLRYDLVLVGGAWLIDDVALAGDDPVAC
jgi:hypothetical protein